MLDYLCNQKERCYSELLEFQTFEERFDYAKMTGVLGEATFGFDRYLNQILYRSRPWLNLRHKIIVRDNACDLAVEGYNLYKNARVHHLNVITKEMIEERHPYVYDPEYLVCVSLDTHTAIHFGSWTGESYASKWKIIERKPNDTVPWR